MSQFTDTMEPFWGTGRCNAWYEKPNLVMAAVTDSVFYHTPLTVFSDN